MDELEEGIVRHFERRYTISREVALAALEFYLEGEMSEIDAIAAAKDPAKKQCLELC